MKLRDRLKSIRRGDKDRITLAAKCFVRPVSRYKILNERIEGLYSDLTDEVYVIELTSKTDKTDKEIVFLGNVAGPHLLKLARQEAPPCFNIVRSTTMSETPLTVGTRSSPPKPYSPFNKELYTAVLLLMLQKKWSAKNLREDGKPISDCLTKLSWNGDEDLPDYWARSINTIYIRYKTSAQAMLNELQRNTGNIRPLKFPLLQKALRKDGVEDIRL